MKNLKKLVATAMLMGIMMIGATNAIARPGMLMSDLMGGTNNQPCTQQTETKADNGIIVSFTGIIVSGFGILFGDFADNAPTDCGIMMSD